MEGGQLLSARIGGFPVVTLVGAAAGGLAILFAVKGRATPKKPNQGVDMLSPSSAEAFGTLQQQQQDLGNALSALGMGQTDILQGENALSLGTQLNRMVLSQLPGGQTAYQTVIASGPGGGALVGEQQQFPTMGLISTPTQVQLSTAEQGQRPPMSAFV